MLVAEAPITMDYGPWKNMSQEGIDFLHGCLDRDYHQRMTVRQVSEPAFLMQKALILQVPPMFCAHALGKWLLGRLFCQRLRRSVCGRGLLSGQSQTARG